MSENGAAVKTREQSKQLSADQYRITVVLTAKQFKDLQRSQSLEAQKQKPAKMSDAIGVALTNHLWKNDPLQKAQRAQVKATEAKVIKDKEFAESTSSTTFNQDAVGVAVSKNGTKPFRPAVLAGNKASPVMKLTLKSNETEKAQNFVPTTAYQRIPLTAAEKHALNLITGGRCMFRDENGKRCNCDRWIDVHHIIPVSEGGTNEISNLTHLCGTHHDLVHQLCLPLDGQITWWRAGASADR